MAKKEKPLYDKDGRWVEERGRIKGAIRKSFRLSPQMKEVLNDARVELPPALKKDGTPGKRPRVRFKCAMCGELFPLKTGNTTMVQVDHIDTVVPLWKTESNMEFEEWLVTIARGVFCDKSNLQVLCSVPMSKNDGKPSCHKKKTDEENYIRRRFKEIQETKGEDFGWIDLKKFAEKKYIEEEIKRFKQDYMQHLKEKDERKRKRKNTKRKRNTRSNKKD